MNAVVHLEARDPFAAARKRYRAELLEIVEELAAELGYETGEFVKATRKGAVAVTDKSNELVIAARIVL
jgi:hypothetical protein